MAASVLASFVAFVAAGSALAAEWQSAEEIKAALIGTGSKFKGFSQGTSWSEEYLPDGTIKGWWGNEAYRGKWSFKGDVMCFDYKGTEDDGCWHLAIKGDKVFWWKEDGTPDGDGQFVEK